MIDLRLLQLAATDMVTSGSLSTLARIWTGAQASCSICNDIHVRTTFSAVVIDLHGMTNPTAEIPEGEVQLPE